MIIRELVVLSHEKMQSAYFGKTVFVSRLIYSLAGHMGNRFGVVMQFNLNTTPIWNYASISTTNGE